MFNWNWTFGFIGFLGLASGYSFSEKKWKFLLPRDTIKELFELDANSTWDPVGVDREIDRVLRNQTRHVLDQLDLPPYYEQLPFVSRWQIKDVLFDKQLSYEQKLDMIHDAIRKLPAEQRRFPTSESPTPHSRYFEAFSTLQYRVNFNFKLSELKRALSSADQRSVLTTIGNPQLDVEAKLAAIDRIMAAQPFDVLDRLFFAGVPIVDAEVRERFRRLFLERGFWFSPAVDPANPSVATSAAQSSRVHPPCFLKPWCRLQHFSTDPPPTRVVPTKSSLNAQPPATSIVIEVSKNAPPIVSAVGSQPTSIVVDGKPVVVKSDKSNETPESTNPIRDSRIEVVVQSQPSKSEATETGTSGPNKSQSDEPLAVESAKTSASQKQTTEPRATMNFQPSNGAVPWTPPQQSRSSSGQSSFDPWRPPKSEMSKTKTRGQTQTAKSTSSSTSSVKTNIVTTPPSSTTRPSRWSSASGVQRPLKPWTPRDERDFLQRWYRSFGVALRDETSTTSLAKTSKGPVEHAPEDTRPSVSAKTLSPAAEVDIAALQIAHENREKNRTTSKLVEQQSDESDETPGARKTSTPEASGPGTSVEQAKRIDAEERRANGTRELDEPVGSNWKHVESKTVAMDERLPKLSTSRPSVQAALQSPTIRPPTVVINKEAKEKLVVRHSQLGNTLHLEKLTSEELREVEQTEPSTTTVQASAPPKSWKNEDVNTTETSLLSQTMNDDSSGVQLLESLQHNANDSATNKDIVSSSAVPAVSTKPVPSGLIKLRDVLRQLRDRIRANKSNSTQPTFS